MHFQSMQDAKKSLNGSVILMANHVQANQLAGRFRAAALDVQLASVMPASLATFAGELKHAALVLADVGKAQDAAARLRELRELVDEDCAIVLIADAQDLAFAREMRRLGASEYFASPADDDELFRAVCDVLGLGGAERARRGSRLIAVHGVVGGAGAGLISAGLATLIAEQYGRRSVLVDWVLGNASAGAWLGSDRPGELSSLLHTPERLDLALLEQVMQRPSSQLALLDGRSEQQNTPPIDAQSCQQVAEILAQHYRYQVWRSSGLDKVASHNLLQADLCVLVADGSLNALRNVRELLPWLKEQRPEAQTLLVFNASRPDAVLDDQAFSEALGRPADVVLPYCRKLAAQQLDAVPFNLGKHVLHKELDRLACLVLGLPTAKARNWFGMR